MWHAGCFVSRIWKKRRRQQSTATVGEERNAATIITGTIEETHGESGKWSCCEFVAQTDEHRDEFWIWGAGGYRVAYNRHCIRTNPDSFFTFRYSPSLLKANFGLGAATKTPNSVLAFPIVNYANKLLTNGESWNEPKRVEGLENVKVCTAFASRRVSAAVGDDGSVWVWGKSKHGQLSLGKHITKAIVPARVEALSGENVAKIHSLYLNLKSKK